MAFFYKTRRGSFRISVINLALIIPCVFVFRPPAGSLRPLFQLFIFRPTKRCQTLSVSAYFLWSTCLHYCWEKWKQCLFFFLFSASKQAVSQTSVRGWFTLRTETFSLSNWAEPLGTIMWAESRRNTWNIWIWHCVYVYGSEEQKQTQMCSFWEKENYSIWSMTGGRSTQLIKKNRRSLYKVVCNCRPHSL